MMYNIEVTWQFCWAVELLYIELVCVTDQETATYPTCVGVARV